MHLFDADCKLHKYKNVSEIIDDFYKVRMMTYHKRKDYLVADLKARLLKMSNRARYIQETLSGAIDLRRKTAAVVNDLLKSMAFDEIDGDYKYLIKMPMDSVTEENIKHIMEEKTKTEEELNRLIATTLSQMWLNELNLFSEQYELYKQRRNNAKAAKKSAPPKKTKK
jgi:DNA topoisomerase-2